MLLAGADVNRQDGSGATPLYFAALNKYTEVARLLLNERADINLKNSLNKTPLYIADKGSEVEYLLLQYQRSPP